MTATKNRIPKAIYRYSQGLAGSQHYSSLTCLTRAEAEARADAAHVGPGTIEPAVMFEVPSVEALPLTAAERRVVRESLDQPGEWVEIGPRTDERSLYRLVDLGALVMDWRVQEEIVGPNKYREVRTTLVKLTTLGRRWASGEEAL